LLERAFAEAGKLSPAEQDLLASRVLAELTNDDEFDRAIAAPAAKLTGLAEAALAEHRAGVTHTDGIDVLERDSSLRSE
jgi:hypothetical protein